VVRAKRRPVILLSPVRDLLPRSAIATPLWVPRHTRLEALGRPTQPTVVSTRMDTVEMLRYQSRSAFLGPSGS
jgi:hypothetical protein